MLIHPWDQATKAEWQEVLTHVLLRRRPAGSTPTEQRAAIAEHLAERDGPMDAAAHSVRFRDEPSDRAGLGSARLAFQALGTTAAVVVTTLIVTTLIVVRASPGRH